MFSISKSDKQEWENYINNFKSSNISLKNYKKNQVNKHNETFNTSPLRFFKKEKKNKPEGIIDLHGYRLYTAKITLHNYIVNAYEKKIRNILVITGKGYKNTGRLKKEVPLWLNDKTLRNLLINYETAPSKFGGEGALLVRIKNKNKS